MTSIFDSAEYYDRFYNALCEIDRRYNANNINNSANNNQNYAEHTIYLIILHQLKKQI